MITSVRIDIGDEGRKVMPWSEACMHMRVHDKVMRFRLVSALMVQLLNDDGSPFSIPITHGEAGVFHDEDGYYYHEAF